MLVCWVLLGNVLIISPIKECFKRPFKECLAMFVYTQHTRSVHTAYTQHTHSIVYTHSVHTVHTLWWDIQNLDQNTLCVYAVCTLCACCVYAVCTLCVPCHFFNENVYCLFVDVLRTKEVDKSPMIFPHSPKKRILKGNQFVPSRSILLSNTL